MTITSDLKTANWEINNGLIDLTKDFRKKEPPTSKKMIAFFTKMPLWLRVKQGHGHATFKHKLTGITVGVQAHMGGKKDSKLHPKHAKSILESVQEHINILSNEIFTDKSKDPKGEFDYTIVTKNWKEREEHKK